MYRADNMAYKYDLNKYRNLTTAESEEVKRDIIIKKKASDKGSSIKIVAMAFVALVLLFCVIYGKVQINKVYSDINSQKAELASEQSENARLRAERESYTSRKKIEDYAENVLGLEKLDKSQIMYINVQSDDVVIIPENEDNIFVKIKDTFNEIIDYITG
ncbi:MAG: hypothetical protein Q4F95_11205 [Oscillospiraceae bacterium]|nr:hypothetical protein [Oscillospiraceae bacterium]